MTVEQTRRQYYGNLSRKERGRLKWLVETGRANWWYPYRTPEQTIIAAGLV